MLDSWMWIYYWIVLCSRGSKESACPHVIKREASFHVGFHWQHGRHHICIYGASQLHSLCGIFCFTASRTFKLDSGVRVQGKSRALARPSVGYVNENLQLVPEEVRYARVPTQ